MESTAPSAICGHAGSSPQDKVVCGGNGMRDMEAAEEFHGVGAAGRGEIIF